MNAMSTVTEQNVWLARPKANANSRLRLFCFPYAGGGALAFRGWAAALPAWVEVCPVRLPGREGRIREAALTRVKAVAESAAEALLPSLGAPFALFGHSMGAFVAFELARLLRRRGGPRPARLFASGCRAPHIPRKRPTTYDRPEAEFLDELRRLNGTPREVLDDPELMRVMLPLLRADFEASETYDYTPEAPLDCPVTAFGGQDDPEAARADVRAWCEHTTAPFTLKVFPGDHFFLHAAQGSVLGALSGQLEQDARAGAF
jgi:medium-chain acyl-[acyl-carrier-protein] hydrolase